MTGRSALNGYMHRRDQVLKVLTVVLLLMFGCTAFAAPPRLGPKYETDAGTVNFLRYHLIYGGEIHYPSEAHRLKQQGSGVYLMKLRRDGSVASLTVKKSASSAIFDKHVTRTLEAYRFKPETKTPLLWLVSFAQPATVIIKMSLVDEGNLPIFPQ